MGNKNALWDVYGPERDVPTSAQMYVLTSEQFNWIASLVVGTNDVFTFQIPYPFYVDQQSQAIIFHRIDFIHRRTLLNSPSVSTRRRLQVDLQYSDKEPAADWDGAGEDTEDESIQAMFDGPFLVGESSEHGSSAPDADATVPFLYPDSAITNVHYYPPDRNGLDAFFPVTVVLTNMSFSRDLVDEVADAEDNNAFDSLFLRCFFTTRNLTAQERAMMNSEYYGLVPLS